jgi:hypothetical protein
MAGLRSVIEAGGLAAFRERFEATRVIESQAS